MNEKMSTILEKTAEVLDTIKERLAKDFSSFGSVIGGGTKEAPTIKPSESTSQDVRESGGSSWFGMSEDAKKEKINHFDNGQWNIEEMEDARS